MPYEPDALLSTFLDEADEHLAALESGLLRASDGAPDTDLLNGVFRAAHSIKGGSGLFGFEAVTRLTHSLEQLLDRLRKGQLPTTRDRIDLLLRAVDGLTGLLAAARAGSASDVPTEMIRELNEAAGVESARPPAAAGAEEPGGANIFRVSVSPGPDLLTNGMDPLLLLRNLGREGELLTVTPGFGAVPTLDDIDPMACYLTWVVTIRSECGPGTLREVFQFVENDCRVDVDVVTCPANGGLSGGTAEFPAVRHDSLADLASAINRLAAWGTDRLPVLKLAVAGPGR